MRNAQIFCNLLIKHQCVLHCTGRCEEILDVITEAENSREREESICAACRASRDFSGCSEHLLHTLLQDKFRSLMTPL